MKKLIERLLIFFVGAPVILSSIYFLPHYNFLVYHVEMLIVGIIASFEMCKILSKKFGSCPKLSICISGSVLIIISYLIGLGLLSSSLLLITFGIILVILLCKEVFVSFDGDFSHSIERLCSSLFMLIYPWTLMIFVSRTTIFENAPQVILAFYLIIFACDSAAWFFGMLFGKSTRGFFKASPKKSLVGFIGGIVMSMVIAFLITVLFPNLYGDYVFQWLIIGAVLAVFAILGDIIESVLKRSSDVKDSGNVVMGRGGILDSIDSSLIAAPVYYFLYQLLICGGF